MAQPIMGKGRHRLPPGVPGPAALQTVKKLSLSRQGIQGQTLLGLD